MGAGFRSGKSNFAGAIISHITEYTLEDDENPTINPFLKPPNFLPKPAFFLSGLAFRLLRRLQRNFCSGMSVLNDRIYIITKWSVLYEDL